MEYSDINITCKTNGGNPSDPRNYIYNWMYKPVYGASTAYIPVPSGKFLRYIFMVSQIRSNYSNSLECIKKYIERVEQLPRLCI